MSYEDEKWPSNWLTLLGFLILAPFVYLIGLFTKRRR